MEYWSIGGGGEYLRQWPRLAAASSVGKWPLALSTLRNFVDLTSLFYSIYPYWFSPYPFLYPF